MCDSSARPTLHLNPPALFDVLWPPQSTSPNISLGFPFRFASAIGQMCGLSQGHPALSVPRGRR